MNKTFLKSFIELGFTEHEARAYVSLLEHGAQTGYELAKNARLPRPNIYPILDRLEKRGIVSSVQIGPRKRYNPLPADQMLAKISGHLTTHVGTIKEGLRRLAMAPAQEAAWNVRGQEAVLNKAREIFRNASKNILVGLWAAEAKSLVSAMAEADARALKLSVLCIQGCEHECGGCRGTLYRYPLASQSKNRWLVVSGDNREILLAQFQPDGSVMGLHSTMDVLVSVGSHYLRNAIAVSEIFRSGGNALVERLDAQALDALRGTGLALDGQSWLDHILEAVSN